MLQAAAQLLDAITGCLFVSTMNWTMQLHLLAIVTAEYVMCYLPPGTKNDWNQSQSPEQLNDKMRLVGLVPSGPPMGMVLAGPPPPFGTWHSWRLITIALAINWILAYHRYGSTTTTTSSTSGHDDVGTYNRHGSTTTTPSSTSGRDDVGTYYRHGFTTTTTSRLVV